MNDKYYFPCPICRKMLLVEIAKNEKPYCKCNDCGVQLFVRGKKGMKMFANLIGKLRLQGDSKELISTLDHFNSLKNMLEEIQENKPILGTDMDLELQEKVILMQLDRLRKNIRGEIT